jgi:hypothetical protein
MGFLTSFFVSACTHEPVQTLCATPTTVSFSKDILPVFNQYCSTSGCHAGASPSGNLNLETAVAYAQLTRKGKGYIDTLTPQYSVLFSSMNATYNPMPPTGKLDKCTIDKVLNWIQQKAKNN